MPNIRECTSCKSKENITHFSIIDNGFKCKACSTLRNAVDNTFCGVLIDQLVAAKVKRNIGSGYCLPIGEA